MRPAGVLLAQELLPDGRPPQPPGARPCVRSKRRAPLEDLFMPLCVVAYGDADLAAGEVAGG